MREIRVGRGVMQTAEKASTVEHPGELWGLGEEGLNSANVSECNEPVAHKWSSRTAKWVSSFNGEV